mmetsp:Transcript_66112/g.138091  ORF Transcript_66112/g.138091 Transcript_66112/m.138091 type:complete len:280 (+) Transcript_66112:436-1275(+)
MVAAMVTSLRGSAHPQKQVAQSLCGKTTAGGQRVASDGWPSTTPTLRTRQKRTRLKVAVIGEDLNSIIINEQHPTVRQGSRTGERRALSFCHKLWCLAKRNAASIKNSEAHLGLSLCDLAGRQHCEGRWVRRHSVARAHARGSPGEPSIGRNTVGPEFSVALAGHEEHGAFCYQCHTTRKAWPLDLLNFVEDAHSLVHGEDCHCVFAMAIRGIQSRAIWQDCQFGGLASVTRAASSDKVLLKPGQVAIVLNLIGQHHLAHLADDVQHWQRRMGGDVPGA